MESANLVSIDWATMVQDELKLARAKFPKPDLLTLAFVEESGEFVQAVLDLRAGKGSHTRVIREGIQAMAMVVRLLEEGDPQACPDMGIPAEHWPANGWRDDSRAKNREGLLREAELVGLLQECRGWVTKDQDLKARIDAAGVPPRLRSDEA